MPDTHTQTPVPEQDEGPNVFQCFVLGIPLPITFARLPCTDPPTSYWRWYKEASTSSARTIKTWANLKMAKK
ncbi:hypothetical protein HK104_004996, partial [Borealophlyctis nickersoniae]